MLVLDISVFYCDDEHYQLIVKFSKQTSSASRFNIGDRM